QSIVLRAMPEYPDITVYIEALLERLIDRRLVAVSFNNPFVLRTVTPPPSAAVGHRVLGLRRLGKRIAIGFEGDLWFVMHLMIAGRLHWVSARKPVPRSALVALDFETGRLTLTEAGSKRRASLHVCTADDLSAHEPGGMDVLTINADVFRAALLAENRTLKRCLTDPGVFSGIGNAYSDEILHRAGLSPITHSQKLSDEEVLRLYQAVKSVLSDWIDRLRRANGRDFPEKVTAFRPEMAVHGRYGKPCPICGTKIQRIRYADNETNYCPRCQTAGRLLADRALSRLLKAEWPKNIDEWEAHRP
ncbi:MAG: Fpg/Nei family DNA glycosylase, partial [Gammaproteobacteria bacterium]